MDFYKKGVINVLFCWREQFYSLMCTGKVNRKLVEFNTVHWYCVVSARFLKIIVKCKLLGVRNTPWKSGALPLKCLNIICLEITFKAISDHYVKYSVNMIR